MRTSHNYAQGFLWNPLGIPMIALIKVVIPLTVSFPLFPIVGKDRNYLRPNSRTLLDGLKEVLPKHKAFKQQIERVIAVQKRPL